MGESLLNLWPLYFRPEDAKVEFTKGYGMQTVSILKSLTYVGST